jgi:hypothetical protein
VIRWVLPLQLMWLGGVAQAGPRAECEAARGERLEEVANLQSRAALLRAAVAAERQRALGLQVSPVDGERGNRLVAQVEGALGALKGEVFAVDCEGKSCVIAVGVPWAGELSGTVGRIRNAVGSSGRGERVVRTEGLLLWVGSPGEETAEAWRAGRLLAESLEDAP